VTLNRAGRSWEKRTRRLSLLRSRYRFTRRHCDSLRADVDKAERLLSRFTYTASAGDREPIVGPLLFCGWVCVTRGRFEEAEAIWRRALNVVDPTDHGSRRADRRCRVNRSEMHDLAGALQLIDERVRSPRKRAIRFQRRNTSVQKVRVLDD